MLCSVKFASLILIVSILTPPNLSQKTTSGPPITMRENEKVSAMFPVFVYLVISTMENNTPIVSPPSLVNATMVYLLQELNANFQEHEVVLGMLFADKPDYYFPDSQHAPIAVQNRAELDEAMNALADDKDEVDVRFKKLRVLFGVNWHKYGLPKKDRWPTVVVSVGNSVNSPSELDLKSMAEYFFIGLLQSERDRDIAVVLNSTNASLSEETQAYIFFDKNNFDDGWHSSKKSKIEVLAEVARETAKRIFELVKACDCSMVGDDKCYYLKIEGGCPKKPRCVNVWQCRQNLSSYKRPYFCKQKGFWTECDSSDACADECTNASLKVWTKCNATCGNPGFEMVELEKKDPFACCHGAGDKTQRKCVVACAQKPKEDKTKVIIGATFLLSGVTILLVCLLLLLVFAIVFFKRRRSNPVKSTSMKSIKSMEGGSIAGKKSMDVVAKKSIGSIKE